MEFKGTKGKWEVKKVANQNWVWANVRGGECLAKFSDIEENKANAQLISKAPEMLDFINRISGEMLRNDFVLDERWYDQARELIKQATEI